MGGEPLLLAAFDWIICGGESGPHARPMHPDWARATRDVCQKADIPFFFKQWGAHVPIDAASIEQIRNHKDVEAFDDVPTYRVGKHAAGARLDGAEWKESPQC